MLINNQNKVFVGQRISEIKPSLQMPQGGIDKNETPLQAALRELDEEVGTQNVNIIAESQDWLKYELPNTLPTKRWMKKYKGQKQKWFLMEFLGTDSEINLNKYDPEFSRWEWIEPKDLPEIIVYFKKKLYEEVLKQFSKYLSN